MTVGPVDRDAATAEFFDGTAAGKFLLRCCPDGHFSEPAAAQCTTCASTGLKWTAAAGGASLISWAVSWGRAGREQDQTATVLVIAELDEGPWWWSQLVGVDDAGRAGLAVGDRLAIAFIAADPDHPPVPVFELAS